MKIYSNLNPTQKEIKAYLNSAKNRIKAAKALLIKELYRDSISRSYYAFLDAAKAALLTKGKTAKTHAGVLTLFGMEFGKTKIIPSEFIKFYRKVLEDRMAADYSILEQFTETEAKEAIKMAKKFVKFIEENLIKQ